MNRQNGNSTLIHNLKRFISFVLQTLLVLAVLCSGIWATMALWFQLPISAWFTITVITVWWLLSIAVLIGWFTRHSSRHRTFAMTAVYVIGWIIILGWWHTIQPQQNKLWAPDVARQLQVEQQANLVTLHNVRNFEWRSATDFTPHWETRRYDLNKLSSMDVITSYWMGPQIAHILLSFGFSDGQYVTFSVETRREQQEVFSTFGGFFRKFELSLIAADERDIIFTRTNIRHEQVYLYHLQVSKAVMRSMFESYLQEARELEQQPRFYNTLTSNCTTVVFDMARLIDPALPIDYRIVLSGYLPQYLYQQHVLDPQLSMAQLQKQAYINPLALQYARGIGQQDEIIPPTNQQRSIAFSAVIRRKHLAPLTMNPLIMPTDFAKNHQ